VETEGTIRKVSNFLFRLVNREFLIFLFFFIVAGIFWLLMTLNESFEQEIQVPVVFKGVPRNVVITSGESDSIHVLIRDKGISLVTYLYGKSMSPIEIDFNRYSRTDGTGTVGAAELLPLVAKSLPSSATAVSMKPEQITFFYNHGEKKLVPVEYQGRVEPEQIHFIYDVSYSPDSVTIYAPQEKLDVIDKVYTMPINHTGFRDSLSVSTSLQKMEGVKMEPTSVSVTFHTDVLTEASIEGVQVVGINVPEGKVLRTFPAKVKVSFVTGMKNYQTLSPDNFLVIADYQEVANTPHTKCRLHLRAMPDGLQRVELETDRVDYIIEEHTP